MEPKSSTSLPRTVASLATAGMTVVMLAGSVFLSTNNTPAAASSHREAPLVSRDPSVDNTDTYAFVSPDRPDTVTLVGSWIPGELPQGGPNFYSFGDDVVYYLYVDSDGDAKPNVTYKFQFATQIRNGQTFLYNVGPIGSLSDPNWNMPQTYTMTEIINGVENIVARNLQVAPVNVGTKSTPQYEQLWLSSVAKIPSPEGELKVFAGPTDDPFWIDLGSVFDLLTLRGNAPPVGYDKGRKKPTDGLHRFNVHSISVQVPISRLLKGAPAGETVIGVWAASERYSMPVLGGGKIVNGGQLVQVSRLGMPLVNELVIGIDDKDKFNASKPKDDGANFADYVTNPVLPALIQTLFPTALAPTNFPRTDLVTVFLKGISGVNQPTTVVSAEMMRLNTSVAPKAAGAQNVLGVAGGDNAGFPNGRRPADDVVDVTLRVSMGALCVLTGATDTLKVGCKPSDAPAGGLALTDGVRKTPANYGVTFPYLTTPLPGNLNPPPAAGTVFP